VLVCAQPARAASLMGTLAAPQRAGAAEPAEGSSAEAEPMSKESEELCAAAASGRTEHAKRLLENGADVNAACWYECDAGGQRDMQWGRAAALLCAARFGQAEAVHLLIEAGADPDKIGNVTTGEKMWVTAVSHCTA